MNDEVYYFAYGSNLNPQRMKNRKAYFYKRKLGKLLDFEFILNFLEDDGTAAANIQPSEGGCVYGALYSCTPDTLKQLDIYEGVKDGLYKRLDVNVICENASIEAVAYIACNEKCKENINKVQPDYLQHILCGQDILPAIYFEFLKSFISWTKF